MYSSSLRGPWDTYIDRIQDRVPQEKYLLSLVSLDKTFCRPNVHYLSVMKWKEICHRNRCGISLLWHQHSRECPVGQGQYNSSLPWKCPEDWAHFCVVCFELMPMHVGQQRQRKNKTTNKNKAKKKQNSFVVQVFTFVNVGHINMIGHTLEYTESSFYFVYEFASSLMQITKSGSLQKL